MKKNLIAIVVIAYNRKNSLERLLNSLCNAEYSIEVPLYISIDKGNNQDVVDCANQFEWKHGIKNIIIHKENLGLRKHVLSCGELLSKYEALVVLEDDVIVSKYFYSYTLQTVEKYSDDLRVAGISLYSFNTIYHNSVPFIPKKSEYDVYFMQNAQSWGQIWMRKQWNEFMNWYRSNSDEFGYETHLPESICSWKKSSWLKYHTKYCIEKGKYFVYPYESYSSNAGEAGTHASFSSPLFIVPLCNNHKSLNLPSFDDEVTIYDSFFENQRLVKHLQIQESEICIDLNGLKGNRMSKRYWLSLKPQKYKVVKSYGLNMRPIEENVFENVSGNSFFLYDTTIKSNGAPSTDLRTVFFYLKGFDVIHILDLLKEFGYFNYFKTMINVIRKKYL